MKNLIKKVVLTFFAVFVFSFVTQTICMPTQIYAANSDVKVFVGSSTNARHFYNIKAGNTSEKLSFSLASKCGTRANNTWVSSDTSVFTVSNKTAKTCTITAKKEGTAVLTLTITTKAGKTYKEKIFVSSWTNIPNVYGVMKNTGNVYRGASTAVSAYEVNSNKGSLAAGQYIYIKMKCGNYYYADSVAGKVFADGQSKGFIKKSDITTPVPVKGVSITGSSTDLEIHEEKRLYATVSPSYANNQKVTWSSSNTSVATVDSSGMVKALSWGTATITVKTDDGGKTASYKVNVVKENNGLYDITATPHDGNRIDLTWTAFPSVMQSNEIYRSTEENGYYVKIASYIPTVSSYSDDCLENLAGTKFYYKILYRNKAGSNFSKVASATVRHHVDEYSFSFSNSQLDLNYSDKEPISFESRFLWKGNSSSIETIESSVATDGAWTGSCYGMCATSLMFSKENSGLSVTDFKNTAKKISDLSISDNKLLGVSLKSVIGMFHISQRSSNMRKLDITSESIMKNFKFINKTGKPVIIAVYGVDNKGKQWGHAVLAYAYENVSASEDRIYIYDPNFPKKERYIKLTKENSNITKWFYKVNDVDNVGTDFASSQIYYYDTTGILTNFNSSLFHNYINLKNYIVENGQTINYGNGMFYRLSYTDSSDKNQNVYLDFYPNSYEFRFSFLNNSENYVSASMGINIMNVKNINYTVNKNYSTIQYAGHGSQGISDFKNNNISVASWTNINVPSDVELETNAEYLATRDIIRLLKNEQLLLYIYKLGNLKSLGFTGF